MAHQVIKPLNNKVLSLRCFVFENRAGSIVLTTKQRCWQRLLFSFFCLRSIIQAKLLQSPEVTGVYSNKPAHPEDEGHLPQENRYPTTKQLPLPHWLSNWKHSSFTCYFGRLYRYQFILTPYVAKLPMEWDYVTSKLRGHLWYLFTIVASDSCEFQ